MNRPNSNAPPARRRITPIAVNAQDQVLSAAFAVEQPLLLGPAPASGSTQDISTCGPGRRVWVHIQNNINIKFKDVLRQQGLEYATWKKDVEQRRAKLEGAPQGSEARRKGITGRLYQRTLGLYEASDEEAASDQDESEEGGTSSDGAQEDAVATGDDAAGSEGDDDDEDDEDDDKEGNETGGEIDLDKEEEAAKAHKAAKPKRQRFERYDDDFIDDSELEMVKGAAREVKTKFSGFYATKGGIEVVEEPTKPRKSKPKAPKAPQPAADAAKPDDPTTAAGAAAAVPAAGKKRKQVDKQKQGADLTAPGAAAAAVNGVDAGKKKRQRSETPAAAAAGGTVGAQGAADKPPAPKKVKPTPVPAGDAAAATAPPAVSDGGLGPAPAAAGPGTAKLAVAAALAAKQKKRIQPERVEGSSSHKAAAAATAAADDGPMAVPAAADSAKPEAAPATTAAGAAATDDGQQPMHARGPQEASAAAPAAAAAAGGGLAGARSDTPSATAAVATDAGGVPDAAASAAAAAAAAAGLPADLVAAIHTLQEKVVEHKPSGTGASMSKPVKQAVKGIGFKFLLMPEHLQQQHQDNLLQVLTPLMRPYGKDRKLRKELFEVPKKELDDSRQKYDILIQQLQQMKQQQAAPGPGGDDDDFQSAPWTADAEQALVEAWKATEVQQELLQQLAVDVFETLGMPQQPDRALEQLRQIYSKAKKKARKESKKDQQQMSQAPTPGSTTPQPTSLQQQSSISSMEATASLPASRQSPAPESLAAAAAAGGGGGGDRGTTPNCTPLKADRAGSVGMGAGLADGAAGSGAAAGGGSSAGTAVKKEQEKFSTCQVPSPRLQRCLEAAESSGASHDWLVDHYPRPNSILLNQLFRVLCMAGPQGCTVKGMVAKAAEYGLGFQWEDNANQRSAITSSLQHTQAGIKMAGVTETDPAAFALQCFKGVNPQPVKPKQPKSATDVAAGPSQATAADEAGQQAAE